VLFFSRSRGFSFGASGDPSSGKRDTHGIREKRGTWEGGRERDPLGRKSVATLHGTRAAGLKKCAEPGWRGAGSDPVAP
jgi:hypothetical protein